MGMVTGPLGIRAWWLDPWSSLLWAPNGLHLRNQGRWPLKKDSICTHAAAHRWRPHGCSDPDAASSFLRSALPEGGIVVSSLAPSALPATLPCALAFVLCLVLFVSDGTCGDNLALGLFTFLSFCLYGGFSASGCYYLFDILTLSSVRWPAVKQRDTCSSWVRPLILNFDVTVITKVSDN